MPKPQERKTCFLPIAEARGIRRSQFDEAREIWRNGFVTFDTETTGLGLEQDDEIIQWAVCSQYGKVLGNGFVKPTVPISEGAFEIHGISEEQVASASLFAEVWPTIRELLADRTVVIYNASFDMGMLWSSARPYGIEIPYDLFKNVCAMHLFAQFYGEIHEYFGTYTWQKLNDVAIPYLKIEVPGLAHNAEHDAAATAMVIQKLAELADQELPPGWHPPALVLCAGCGHVVQECAEANEIWYCQQCGLEHGVFHRCPGCHRVVKVPATGIACDDLCTYCQEMLHQEQMVLTGVWHWCPETRYHRSKIVQTADLDELCESCKQQREWKRQQEEVERALQVRLEQKRKELRCAYAKAYRERKREREQENRRRAEQGLPLLELPARPPIETLFQHNGHHFLRRKDQHGRPEVYCLKCEAVWGKPPRCYCAGVKTYRAWTAIPEHLKTRTQLLKLRLQPAKGQKAAAVIDGAFDRYCLYDQNMCVPVERKQRIRKKIASN